MYKDGCILLLLFLSEPRENQKTRDAQNKLVKEMIDLRGLLTVSPVVVMSKTQKRKETPQNPFPPFPPYLPFDWW